MQQSRRSLAVHLAKSSENSQMTYYGAPRTVRDSRPSYGSLTLQSIPELDIPEGPPAGRFRPFHTLSDTPSHRERFQWILRKSARYKQVLDR